MLQDNLPAAPVAFGSGPQGRFRAKRPAVSAPPRAPFVVFGRLCRNQLVQGLTFRAP